MRTASTWLTWLCRSCLLALMALAGTARAESAGTPSEESAPAPTPGAAAAPVAAPGGPTAPACPPGLFWQNGACVPAPYPACAPGYFFDGYYCIPVGRIMGDPQPGYQAAEEERAFALRLQHRMRGKLTIDLQGGLGFVAPRDWGDRTSVLAPTGVVMLGYRRNYQQQFGALFRGGALFGIPILNYNDPYSTENDESDGTLMYGVIAEAAPYFGPFGRFYIGPSVFAGYVAFEKSNLQAGPVETGFHLSDGVLYGLGLAGGVVVGEREQTDITFSFRMDLNPDHKATLFLMGGVGFHR